MIPFLLLNYNENWKSFFYLVFFSNFDPTIKLLTFNSIRRDGEGNEN